MSTTPVVWKSQSQANTADAAADPDGSPAQFDGQVAALADGGYVVVWEDRSFTYSPYPLIVGQRYDAQGNRVGGEQRLDGVFGGGTSPSVAALPNGGFAMAYVVDGNQIWVQLFDDDMVSYRFDVAENRPGPASNPSITIFADGGYLVSYEFANGADTDILGRIANPFGHFESTPNLADGSDEAENPELARFSNGNVVVVYTEQDAGDPHSRVGYHVVTPIGHDVTDEEIVSGGGPLSEFDPDVAALTDGGFAVAWTDESGNASGTRIRAAVYDNDGNVVRPMVFVNTTDAGHQNEANVVALADGGFLVTWEDDFADLVRAQRFDAFGNVVGTEFIVHDGIAADSPQAAMLSDGRIAYAIGDQETGDHDVVTSIWDSRPPQGPNNVLWQHAEGSPALSDNVLSVVATTSVIRHTGDFDADGDSDILWRHDDGSVVTWMIEGSALAGNHILAGASMSWQIYGTGDFDGDGDDDIVWHHDAGMVVTWEIENGTLVTNHNHSNVSTAWRIVGTGDFDSDGDDDLLWRHTGGQVVTWEMEDGNYVVNHNLPGVTANWQVRGTDDFDGDGDADILWHHVSGQVVTWEMEDGTYVTNHNIESSSGGWRIRGAGDLDSDGDADILWRHNDGRVVTWEMEDGAFVTNHNYGLIPQGWEIRGIGAFDLA